MFRVQAAGVSDQELLGRDRPPRSPTWAGTASSVFTITATCPPHSAPAARASATWRVDRRQRLALHRAPRTQLLGPADPQLRLRRRDQQQLGQQVRGAGTRVLLRHTTLIGFGDLQVGDRFQPAAQRLDRADLVEQLADCSSGCDRRRTARRAAARPLSRDRPSMGRTLRAGSDNSGVFWEQFPRLFSASSERPTERPKNSRSTEEPDSPSAVVTRDSQLEGKSSRLDHSQSPREKR